MPSNPPTVADLEQEVAILCGIALADAGVYLRGVDAGGVPMTPAIRIGLRKGAKAVGLFLPDPMVLADADVANLSSYALEYVLAHGQLFGLQVALLHWHRAVQKEEPALSANPMAGGWLMEERRAIRDRVSELKATCSQPFQEPTGDLTVRTPTLPFGLNPISTTAPNATEPDPPAIPCGTYGYGNGYGYGFGWGWGGYW